MANDPQADLIYAILALDSYNRGYGAGINDLGASGSLGNFSILDVPLPDGSQAAGFYGIAYRNAATGEVVISYRGTDVPGKGDDDVKGGSDVDNGYGLALGLPGSGSVQVGITVTLY